MTGPPGQPLRAGASIIDIMGAVFGVIALALIFMFTIRSRFTNAQPTPASPVSGWAVALISMALWTCVGLGGRAIGFV